MASGFFRALIDYEDPYVQPLILEAFRARIPATSYEQIDSLSTLSDESKQRVLQFRSYESLDFEQALENHQSLLNSYVIRKALIRKHYLSSTIYSWVTKHPDSVLKKYYEPAVEFEVDYAEFLDDALIEAYELKESFQKNQDRSAAEREWWILKPGMSDRGQGIRLFSTEKELTAIFEEWEEQNPEEDELEEEYDTKESTEDQNTDPSKDYITTSHLRHFIAQPYIDPPLLFAEAPYNNRKFHIRTYVVAAGAIQVFVYKHMLALFASEAYEPPWVTTRSNDLDHDEDGVSVDGSTLERLKNIHLTNTCVQNARAMQSDSLSTQQDHVFLLSKLPLDALDLSSIQRQIGDAVSEVFRAASAQPVNFQPLPQSFEIFGVDFMVMDRGKNNPPDGERLRVSLLEVNAFPDFAQTGDELKDIIKGLFEEVATTVVAPYFGTDTVEPRLGSESASVGLEKVLDLNMGR